MQQGLSGENEMALTKQSLESFVDAVASDAPAPGGGSVAALSAALGASLLCMAIRISAKKQPDDALKALLPQLEKEKDRLVQLVDEDAAAFNQVMAAFALPKNTEDEKNKRAAAIQTAFQHAASVPLETMQCALRVLEAGQTVAQLSSPNVASDVGTGTQMAYAGLQGAGYNVKINLAAIKDDDFKSDASGQAGLLFGRAQASISVSLDAVKGKR